ncbi:nucleotidyltransferase domain-containing protein [Bacteroides sp. UBA939]|uniref:nucleotidyltransferase domain-containing protein n=1 Tax=Bacteroides sp. UBA939 TaxID=1946092 RepID=UPI0025C16010|nr:nucleotidyltransferase domain-containing protein [Bacteroides sp. UBA939]
MKRPHIITRIKEALQSTAPDVKAILYGSEARGDARPDSDIDLLLLLDKDTITLDDKMVLTAPLYDIELETGIQINHSVDSFPGQYYLPCLLEACCTNGTKAIRLANISFSYYSSFHFVHPLHPYLQITG